MGILDFPPASLTGDYSVQGFTIGTRLIVRLVWAPGATATGVFFSLESCTGAACSGFTEFATDLVFPYVDVTTGNAHFLDGYSRELTPSTIYRYRVRNQYAGGYSTYSNTFEITLPAFTPDPVPDPGTSTSKPLAPSLLATGGTANTIDLTWADNSDNELGFILQRYQTDPSAINPVFNWQSIQSLAANSVSYSDTSLLYSSLYYYRIKAFNQYGESTYSNVASKQTDDLAVAGLASPTFTSATVEYYLGSPSIKLDWVDNSTTETAFIIEKKLSTDASFSILQTTSADVITFTDNNVNLGKIYSYRIRAYRSGDTQYSPYSAVKTVGTGTFTGEGQSRTWDGTVSNYIEIIPQGTFTSRSTSLAWIRPASLGVSTRAIFGNRYDAGYEWHINSSDELEIQWANGLSNYTLSTPLTIAGGSDTDWLQVGVPLFVAINVTSSITPGPTTADFYAGFTPSTIVLIGTDSGGTFISNNGVQHVSLGINMFGSTPESPFNGELDRIGMWQGNLSLAELREVARCGGALPPDDINHSLEFFFEITGASPEPTSGTGFDGTIIGTLPVNFGLCGGGVIDEVLPAYGYGIAHDIPEGAATTPSQGGVIRDNQMSNNAVNNISPNVYQLDGVTIDNPGTEFVYIRRGQIIYQ